jgi:hypothetical protein
MKSVFAVSSVGKKGVQVWYFLRLNFFEVPLFFFAVDNS